MRITFPRLFLLCLPALSIVTLLQTAAATPPTPPLGLRQPILAGTTIIITDDDDDDDDDKDSSHCVLSSMGLIGGLFAALYLSGRDARP